MFSSWKSLSFSTVCDGTSPIHGGGRLNSPAAMTGNEEGDNRGFVKDSGASL